MTLLRLGLAASGWLALLAMSLPDAAPLRVAAVTAFLLVCPGLATLLALRPGGPGGPRRGGHPAAILETALVSLVLGLALTTLVAVALFLGGVFTATRSLLALAVLTTAMALLSVRPGARNRDTGVHAG
ncbi:hypothetical protein AQF52_3538 [Streptomyces venezuelae]|uniref:hypothetical protein n=1 Tax=Streptomyces gardneri TaxID=66892 RepID=UPI0006BD693D|nr:hypothetical protein [Streptomyces gardneri]ALO09132.1 hypothetical protein AQF52_3538 [Streptomyces venezuelae]QPK46268.1 hypothetical protein H4W23_17610 [Streptomyces gardneri]WRK37643.1 hypothetical protein U0M97_17700 [Streptomyces venezuelae]CUM40468.1 hypothetical protein; putative membrane protein [Streptomyces venezuelae]